MKNKISVLIFSIGFRLACFRIYKTQMNQENAIKAYNQGLRV